MALTPQQQKQVKLARQMYKNFLINEMFPAMKRYANTQQELLELAQGPRRAAQPEPQETDAEFEAALAEIKSKRSTK